MKPPSPKLRGARPASAFTLIEVIGVLAIMAIIGARRLIRLTLGTVVARDPGPRLPLWRVPLFGSENHDLRDLIPVQSPGPAVEACASAPGGNQGAAS